MWNGFEAKSSVFGAEKGDYALKKAHAAKLKNCEESEKPRERLK